MSRTEANPLVQCSIFQRRLVSVHSERPIFRQIHHTKDFERLKQESFELSQNERKKERKTHQ